MAFSVLFDSNLFLFAPDCGGFRSSVLQMIPTDHNYACVVMIAKSLGLEEITVDICHPEWHFQCFFDSDSFHFAPDCGGFGCSVLWTIQMDMTHIHGAMFVRSGAPEGQSAGQIRILTGF
ncbi:hypothetical protein R3P38DRAFT_3199364 [Favolaschia claudopus]|uniref:Uncharacterized protein n=1 Tax=Favolaschia claudopus TaxID=2862362 RepID=A0AAW0AZW0_9AGAR